MSRYIDVDGVKSLCDELLEKEKEQGNINSANYALSFLKAAIDGLPTADVVEVVSTRGGKCKT